MDSHSLSLPKGIKHHHHQDIDTIFWSNKDIATNKLLICVFAFGFLSSVVSTAYFTYQLYITKLSDQTVPGKLGIVCFYLICWLLIVGFFLTIYSLTSTEAIKISNEDIFIRHFGVFNSKAIRLTKHHVTALSFQRFHSDEQEALHSLNLIYNYDGRRRSSHWDEREQLAFWMRTKEKYQLYLLLENVLRDRDWDIEFKDIL